MIAGTEQPNPISIGTNERPESPILRRIGQVELLEAAAWGHQAGKEDLVRQPRIGVDGEEHIIEICRIVGDKKEKLS